MSDTTDTKPLTVQVPKRIEVTVQRLNGGRVERDFREELAAKIASGYRVTSLSCVPGAFDRGVMIALEKTEEITFDELMEDVHAKLRGE